MNVSYDPRIMKQMLLAEWTSGINPLQSSAIEREGAGEGNGLFDQLLNTLLSSDDTSTISSPGGSSFGIGIAPSYGWGTLLDGGADYGERAFAYDDLIGTAAARYGLDPSLIKGIIQTESAFRADAVSGAGAKGLMQLMDATAAGLGVSDAFDPAQNIDGGSRFLSYLLRKYDGNASVALAAYNAGPGRIDRLGIASDDDLAARMADLPEETQRYIVKVLNAVRSWSA